MDGHVAGFATALIKSCVFNIWTTANRHRMVNIHIASIFKWIHSWWCTNVFSFDWICQGDFKLVMFLIQTISFVFAITYWLFFKRGSAVKGLRLSVCDFCFQRKFLQVSAENWSKSESRGTFFANQPRMFNFFLSFFSPLQCINFWTLWWLRRCSLVSLVCFCL